MLQTPLFLYPVVPLSTSSMQAEIIDVANMRSFKEIFSTQTLAAKQLAIYILILYFLMKTWKIAGHMSPYSLPSQLSNQPLLPKNHSISPAAIRIGTDTKICRGWRDKWHA